MNPQALLRDFVWLLGDRPDQGCVCRTLGVGFHQLDAWMDIRFLGSFWLIIPFEWFSFGIADQFHPCEAS
jgi:hypothetical protein